MTPPVEGPRRIVLSRKVSAMQGFDAQHGRQVNNYAVVDFARQELDTGDGNKELKKTNVTSIWFVVKINLDSYSSPTYEKKAAGFGQG